MKSRDKKSRAGLGKGLANLLADNEKQPVGTGISHLNIEEVRANPNNPRTKFDEQAIDELAKTIELHGVLQPILVQAIEGGGYMVISGERRLRACRKLSLKTVPCVVKEVEESKVLEIALIENIQREQLDVIEEARVYDTLLREQKWTQEKLASQVGKNRVTITNRLRLLQLPETVQAFVADGRLTEGQVRPLLGLGSAELRVKLAKEIERKQLSARECEELVKLQKQGKPAEKKLKKTDASIQAYEKKLSSLLDCRVQLKHNVKNGGGKIIVDYFSLDDLARLEQIFKKK